LNEITIFFNQKVGNLKHDQNSGEKYGILNSFCKPFQVFCIREIPESKSWSKSILSILKVFCEILNDEGSTNVQGLSEKVPEQNGNIFPLESSKYHSEQNISCLFLF